MMRNNAAKKLGRIVGTHVRVETINSTPLLASSESRSVLLDIISRLRDAYRFKLYAVSVIENSFELIIGPAAITSDDTESLTPSMLVSTIKGLFAAITASKLGLRQRIWEVGNLSRTIFTAEEIRHAINSVNYLAVREGYVKTAEEYQYSTYSVRGRKIRANPLPVKLGTLPVEVSGSMRTPRVMPQRPTISIPKSRAA